MANDEAEGESLGNLGSLAQSARLKHLNTARWLLIIVPGKSRWFVSRSHCQVAFGF